MCVCACPQAFDRKGRLISACWPGGVDPVFKACHYIHYLHYGMSGFGKGRNPFGPRLKAGGARLEMSHKDDPYMS